MKRLRIATTSALLLFGIVVLVACSFYWMRADWLPWMQGAFLAATIIGGTLALRLSSFLLLVLGVLRSFMLSLADYEYILPNDFTGNFTIIYHPDGPYEFEYASFLRPKITIRVPSDRLIVTSDTTALHRIYKKQDWRYEDGRIIKQFPDKLAPGFTFVGLRTGGGRGIRPEDPFYKWAQWNKNYYCLTYHEFEVLKEGTKAQAQTSAP